MRLPRWCHRLYAWSSGQFWTLCPGCLEPFGGHEWRERPGGHLASIVTWSELGVRPGERGRSVPVNRAICPACTAAGVGCRSHAGAGQWHLDCEFAPYPRG